MKRRGGLIKQGNKSEMLKVTVDPLSSASTAAQHGSGRKPAALLFYHICVCHTLHSSFLSYEGMCGSKCLTLMVECAVVLQVVTEACSRHRRPGETDGRTDGGGVRLSKNRTALR